MPNHVIWRLSDGLHGLPHDRDLAERDLQSQQHAVPADGCARERALHSAATSAACSPARRPTATRATRPITPGRRIRTTRRRASRPPARLATRHTNWPGATFNHTWFPMNHGNANGVCSTCHTNPNDYSVFQCTNCHTAAQTNPKHSRRIGLCLQQRELLSVP